MWIDKEFRELFQQLMKIAGWLFSFHGYDVLMCCRNGLEELGLISWREETGCVHIHSLTEGIEKAAVGKPSFPEPIFSILECKTPTEDVEVRLAASKMSDAFFILLLWDVLSSSIGFQIKAFQVPCKIDIYQTFAEVARVIDFLSALLDNSALWQIGISALSCRARWSHNEFYWTVSGGVLSGRSGNVTFDISCYRRKTRTMDKTLFHFSAE